MAWQNIKNRYPENWGYIRQKILFERANNKCEKCGKENHSMKAKSGGRIVLTLAHIDHDEKNNSPENLLALCQACHFAMDKADNLRRRKLKKRLYHFRLL